MANYPPRFEMRRFAKALTYATHLHAQQTRKGSDLPYISHLLGVASIVMEYGGDEDSCIAALLHDAAEDQGGKPTLEVIRKKFGKHVAAIVDGCTDAYAEPGAEKPSWQKRKAAYIAHLRDAPDSVKLVSAADKLYNARAILADHREHGDTVFKRFKKSKYETLWYYRRLANTFKRILPGHLSLELERTVKTLENEATPKNDPQASNTRKAVYTKLDAAVERILAELKSLPNERA